MDLNVIDLKNIVAKRLYFWVILCKSVIFVPAKYLCGFAKNRMKNTMVDELKSTIRGYNSVTVDNSDVNINSGEVEYALLPVWMLNIKFKEKMYTFAMNGQTKKVVGIVPMDRGKVIKKCILFFGISFILFFIFNLMRGMM